MEEKGTSKGLGIETQFKIECARARSRIPINGSVKGKTPEKSDPGGNEAKAQKIRGAPAHVI